MARRLDAAQFREARNAGGSAARGRRRNYDTGSRMGKAG